MSYEEDLTTPPNQAKKPEPSEEAVQKQEGLHAPKPSYWPFVVALGLALAFSWMLLHPAVVAIGAIISFIAIVAWGVEPH